MTYDARFDHHSPEYDPSCLDGIEPDEPDESDFEALADDEPDEPDINPQDDDIERYHQEIDESEREDMENE